MEIKPLVIHKVQITPTDRYRRIIHVVRRYDTMIQSWEINKTLEKITKITIITAHTKNTFDKICLSINTKLKQYLHYSHSIHPPFTHELWWPNLHKSHKHIGKPTTPTLHTITHNVWWPIHHISILVDHPHPP